MNFIDRLEKEIASYFKVKPNKDVITCDILGVDSVHLKFTNDDNPFCQEIGVNVAEAFDHSGYIIEVYVLESGSYDFYPVRGLSNSEADDEMCHLDVIKTVLRLMRDDSFFKSLKK